ncbi:tyrosine-protein phosphatase [Isobaculum melis]|uniref:Protein-tyrosine phosphatase n=1 Tax=Isobaculum melis TaxID=142588 RepID=A0A1H9SSK6_9LACT|nr:tyrosine-protein phosphatase [Isobaculum melis]SER88002.1 protein-tyrosine phosphatase [Isobaculum melis]
MSILTINRENGLLHIQVNPTKPIATIQYGTQLKALATDLLLNQDQLTATLPIEAPRYYFRINFQDGTEKIEAERLVDLTGTNNFRDLGGYQTKDGRQVVYGQLYRSDALNQLTAQDLIYLQENLNIHGIIDYRSEQERAKEPDRLWENVNVLLLDPNAVMAELASETGQPKHTYHLSFVERLQQQKETEMIRGLKDKLIQQYRDFILSETSRKVYREVIKAHLTDELVPIVQHCKGGKDRTGFGSALLLHLLGVPKETVMADFLLSDQYRAKHIASRMKQYQEYTDDVVLLENLKALTSTEASYLNASFEQIEASYGDFLTFVKEGLGVTHEEIEQLKAKYLI